LDYQVFVFFVPLQVVVASLNKTINQMVLEVGILPGFTPDLESIDLQSVELFEGRSGYGKFIN